MAMVTDNATTYGYSNFDLEIKKFLPRVNFYFLIDDSFIHTKLICFQAMKDVTKAMQKMNKQLKLPEIQKIMMEFEKQTEIMDMKEEMMSDAIGE